MLASLCNSCEGNLRKVFGVRCPEIDFQTLSPGTSTHHVPRRPLLDWQQAATVEREAPSHWQAASGARHRIDYASGAPTVAVKLQEVTPSCQQETLAIIIHLM